MADESNLKAAKQAMKLTPEEEALYRRHLANLHGPGGVDNEDGTRSTVLVYQVGFDDDMLVIPSIRDGKKLSLDEAVAAAKAEGLDKFPAYKSAEEAEARYQKLHQYMEMDTEQKRRGSTRPAPKPMWPSHMLEGAE